MSDDIYELIAIIVGTIALLAIYIFAGAWIALWLWNVIAIPVFGAPALTYWQMCGLIWLIDVLFPSQTITTKKN
jgi:hypothetical protein